MPNPTTPTLLATYTSPTSQKAFSTPLSAPLPSPNTPTAVKDKVAYLSELRASTKQLQEDINVLLTQKMEEDKAVAAATADQGQNGVNGEKGKSKEQVEEENYGEETVEEDEDDG